jgi:hypothetical protein
MDKQKLILTLKNHLEEEILKLKKKHEIEIREA